MQFNPETFIGQQSLEFWKTFGIIFFGVCIIMGKLVIGYINHLKKHSDDNQLTSEKLDDVDEKISSANEKLADVFAHVNEVRVMLYATLNQKIPRGLDLNEYNVENQIEEQEEDEDDFIIYKNQKISIEQFKRMQIAEGMPKKKKRKIDNF